MVYWDEDSRKDLLIGLADGTVRIYLNTGTDDDPGFDGGTTLQVGEPGSKTDIDVGERATATPVDWNSDGRKDLVIGALDGRIHIYLNEGTDTSPDFRTEQLARENGADLIVPTFRSSPDVMDLNDDGRKDLLTGNTEGELLLYVNVASDEDPAFFGYQPVGSDGVPIDLEGEPRSRPFVCEWTGDDRLDVLIGASDGLVRLYQGTDDIGIRPEEIPGSLPASARLGTPYPNPFNPMITIPFTLASSGWVDLSVFDVRGRRVSHLVAGEYPAGEHRVTWRGRDDREVDLPSGFYFLHLRVGRVSECRKVTLAR